MSNHTGTLMMSKVTFPLYLITSFLPPTFCHWETELQLFTDTQTSESNEPQIFKIFRLDCMCFRGSFLEHLFLETARMFFSLQRFSYSETRFYLALF